MRKAVFLVVLGAGLGLGILHHRAPAEVLDGWAISGTAPSGLSWQSIASGTAMPVIVGGASSVTPGAYALWNIRTGALQLNPNGLSLNSFNLVYTTGTATVTASTPGPFTYPQGSSPSSLQVSGTGAPVDQRALPAGTWNSVTVWGARLGGVVARTPTGTPTLATAGYNTASSNGWLNQSWTFPSGLVSSGSAAAMAVSDWRTQGVTGSPNANVVGWGAYQGTFQYTLSGTSAPTTQVGPVVPTGLLSLTWDATSGTWDHASQNWSDGAAGTPTFYNLDSVAFAGAAGGAVTVSGTQSPGAFAVSAASGTYTFSGGTIGGYAPLAKSGEGTAVFASANAWTGGTILSAGTIRGGHDAAFGTGTIALDGGTIASADAGARTFANPLSIGGDVHVGDTTGTGKVTFSGNATLGAATPTVTTDADTMFSGTVSGAGLVKEGTASLVIGGTATFTGTTAVNAGTLSVPSGGSLAATALTVAPGATLSVAGLVQTFGGSLHVDGTLSGSGLIEGDTTIGGIHAPGSEAVGTQTFTNDLFYQQTGVELPKVDWRLQSNSAVSSGGTSYDQIVVQNDLFFGVKTEVNMQFDGQGSTVNWNDSYWAQDRSFVMYDVAGTTTGADRLEPTPGQSYYDSNHQSLQSVRPDASFGTRRNGNNVEVVYFATPEPSTWAMLAGAAGVAGLTAWRRRRCRRLARTTRS